MSTPAALRLLRGTDLLDLSFGFTGLAVEGSGGDRRLVRADAQTDAWIAVTFGPQHTVEQAFSDEVPGESRDLPVGSLLSGRSVLVFEVGPRDAVPFTEDGLLDAMRRLPLRVVDAAREPDAPPAASTLRTPPAAPDGRDAAVRAMALVRLLRTTAELTARHGPETARALAEAAGVTAAGTDPGAAAVAAGPQDPLADPARLRTGVELPYRLYLSPSQKGKWIHRGRIPAPAPGARTELWHTRLDAGTVRAVWNRERGGDPGAPYAFRQALEPEDRRDIVDLTTGAGLLKPDGTPYTPQPVAVRLLMLSAAGGWLDGLGTWPQRPRGVSLSEWRHRAAMGRDHYVRVMREGFLCPFGHKAVYVRVTERKFDDSRAAYLIQREFVVVRQPLRTYDPNTALPAGPDPASDLANVLFPFTSVRLDTVETPNLVPPADRRKFFPATPAEQPFHFKVTAVDHGGNTVEFRTPLLFLDETLATGAQLAAAVAEYNALDRNPPAGATAAEHPAEASADLLGQSVALAPTLRPDDTRLDVTRMVWGMAAPPALADPAPGDRAVSKNAQFLPQLRWAQAAVPAVGRLSGADATVPVAYARRYALSGFDTVGGPVRKANAGQVFLNLLTPADQPLRMDFGGQRDRSGGLTAPSMIVSGLSRLTGPVSGVPPVGGQDPLALIADGTFRPEEFFRPLDVLDAVGPSLLGVVPLAEVIKGVDGLGKALKVPNFFTETVSAVTGFLSDLGRARQLLAHELDRYPPAARQVADTAEKFATVVGDFIAQGLAGRTGPITMQQVDAAFAAFATALGTLLNTLPAGTDPGVRTLLTRVQQQIATWTRAAGEVVALRDAVQQAANGFRLPETVNARLEWNPDIQPVLLGGSPVFLPDADGRLSLVVDLRGSLRRDLGVGADVSCSLENFSLILVPKFNALRLSFKHVRFVARAGRKPDIDVVLKSVDFIGPLSFVQTLRKLIPVDGFSDPPGIQVTPSGIVARYGLPLPNLAIGVFSLENLRLDAYLDLPFIGRSLEIGFSFCSRQAPFRLTVSLLGGGGFFGIVLTPQRVAVLEAGLEFGAAVSLNFGVASGSLSVMAGIYFRLELRTGESRLTGYFRARGEVDVLGIVSASIEIYLDLTFETATGTVYGRARISVSVHIGFWSQSVTIECEKRFVGSGPAPAPLAGAAEEPPRPPAFAEMMAPYTDPATGARRDPVTEYCTAFAEVS
ncbi:hypothetical protein A6A06_13210 [Streptomyces sp. CB02923]|uniref:hypothetical protein n=1 Tax=Streptomyces sp. CB02923 TaxID=1718985 RepID=UPI00093BF146|nr:hypothetical protein [Streptomyces sp. CB02923]OKI02054.1 hypothetical protein A6A06_13210 [Streptomyces sp. CB02923]